MPPKKAPKKQPGDVKSQPPAKPKVKENARPDPKKTSPLSIGELRNKVYDELLKGTPSDGKLTATRLIMNPATNTIEESVADDSKYRVLDVVPASGHAKIFSMSISHIEQAFVEFLSWSADNIVFAFTSAESLDNFAEMFNVYVKGTSSSQAPIWIAISLFHSNEQFEDLGAWKEIGMNHGYREDAHRHVKDWVDVVQRLPTNVRVLFILERPWRDYRSLRGVTAPLRAEDTSRKLDVAVQMDAWKAIPRKESHLAMTLAAITGVEQASTTQFTEADAEELVKYGCRGFRGK